MPFDDLALSVLNQNSCASCGVCLVACPQDLIQIDELSPFTAEGDSCGDCMDCVDVCPGLQTSTNDSEMRLFGRGRLPSERWTGIWQSQLAGRAIDDTVFERSASGGSATAILLAAFQCLDLDAVVAVGRETRRPWRAAAMLCRSPEELLNCAQSTYQLCSYLTALDKLLKDDTQTSVAVVGTACHIQAP